MSFMVVAPRFGTNLPLDEVSMMDNSILPTLASIHATILSIIFAATLTLYFFSKPIVVSLTESLNDLRYEIAQKMSESEISASFGDFKRSDYLKEGTLDLQKIRTELRSILMRIEVPTMEETEIEGSKLASLLILLSNSYPYSEVYTFAQGGGGSISFTGKRIEFSEQWEKDITSLNNYLGWLWVTSSQKILNLMEQWAERRIAKADSRHEELLPTLIKRFVGEFFQRVNFFDRNLLPKVYDYSHKLDAHQNRLHLRKILIHVGVLSIATLFIGIVLPMFIHLYIAPPRLPGYQLVLLVATMLPYFVYLFYLLKIVVQNRL